MTAFVVLSLTDGTPVLVNPTLVARVEPAREWDAEARANVPTSGLFDLYFSGVRDETDAVVRVAFEYGLTALRLHLSGVSLTDTGGRPPRAKVGG